MRREHRLRDDDDFQRVRRVGAKWSHPLLLLFVAPAGEADHSRFGVTVGRRVGGAVVRNRVRRRIGECVRVRYDRIAPGWDVVVVARATAGQARGSELTAALESLMKRAGLLAGEH